MKKRIITAGVLAIVACTITAFCWATGSENVSEETNAAQPFSVQRAESVAEGAKGKALVVYFSVPETDSVDASSGASRLVSNGKVMGIIRNTSHPCLSEEKHANTTHIGICFVFRKHLKR